MATTVVMAFEIAVSLENHIYFQRKLQQTLETQQSSEIAVMISTKDIGHDLVHWT
jgi:hypothetical protein